MNELSPEIESVATMIVDAAFEVHRRLGPGLLESVYESCFVYELKKRGFRVQCQVALPVVYDDLIISEGLRIDVLVNETIVVELKAVEQDNLLYAAQVKTYLKFAGLKLGFLINFNKRVIKDCIKRIILPTSG